MRPDRWLEDFTVGETFETPTAALGHDEIVAFASRFDPQPFHMDGPSGERSVFGGMVASGWHTAAITHRLVVRHGPRIAGGLVGLGIEELRWRPVRPGDVVRVRGEVLDVRRSATRPGRGVVRVRLQTLNQRGEEVQHAVAALLVPARDPGRATER